MSSRFPTRSDTYRAVQTTEDGQRLDMNDKGNLEIVLSTGIISFHSLMKRKSQLLWTINNVLTRVDQSGSQRFSRITFEAKLFHFHR